MGFRNPFRIGIDPATDTLYVADYGPDARPANPNRGPEGTVEWNIVGQPGNYGWPYCHGHNYAYNDYTFPSGPSGPKFNCAAPVNNSPNNTGLTNLPPAIAGHRRLRLRRQPAASPRSAAAARPMGGPVYRYDAALASDRKWPAYYDGKALFGEWNQNKMYTFQVDADGKSLVDINQLLAGMSVHPADGLRVRPGRRALPDRVGHRLRRQQRRLRRLPDRLHRRRPRPDRGGQRHARPPGRRR